MTTNQDGIQARTILERLKNTKQRRRRHTISLHSSWEPGVVCRREEWNGIGSTGRPPETPESPVRDSLATAFAPIRVELDQQ